MGYLYNEFQPLSVHKYEFYLNFNFLNGRHCERKWWMGLINDKVWDICMGYIGTEFQTNQFINMDFIWIWVFKWPPIWNTMMDEIDQWNGLILTWVMYISNFINYYSFIRILFKFKILNSLHFETKWQMRQINELCWDFCIRCIFIKF